MTKGSCLCGKIEYELTASGLYINNCHCSECRKASGAAFGSFLHISKDNFRWVKGKEYIQVYEEPPDLIRSFCKICGSCMLIIFAKINHVAVPAGTLDDDPGLQPMMNIFTGSKAPWYTITDELPNFEEHSPRDFMISYLKNSHKKST